MILVQLNIKTKQFYVPIRQIQSNLCKNTKINKQSHVKFWFNRKKYGAVSYLFGCNSVQSEWIEFNLLADTLHIFCSTNI